MQVNLKLFAGLQGFLPDGAAKNQIAVDIAEGATVRQLLDVLKVPPQACHLVLLNGVFQPPAARLSVQLKEGDTVAAWPPVAGG